MSGPFKMKGSSFYGHGNSSPIKDTEPHTEGHTHKGDKATTANIIQADEEYNEMKKSKGGAKDKLSERYGGTWGKDELGVWRNEEGLTPNEAETTHLSST